MRHVDEMYRNLRVSGKGVGGLYDTFRVVHRRRGDIYKQPPTNGGEIFHTSITDIQAQSMGKREHPPSSHKKSYKKKAKDGKQTLTSAKRGSNKVKKQRVRGQKKNEKTVGRVKDRF